MGSIANQKGGFYKTIEITRDSAGRSETTLMAPLIKNSENYIVQVVNFVSNASVPIHTFTEPLIEVWMKPDYTAFGNGHNSTGAPYLGDPLYSLPVRVYRTPMEFARQLHDFVDGIAGLTVQLEPDGSVKIKLSRDFGDTHYIKLSNAASELLGLQKILCFFVSDVDPDDQKEPEVEQHHRVFATYEEWNERRDLYVGGAPTDVFQPNYYFLRPFDTPFIAESHGFDSAHTISNLDTRDSIELEMTLPHIATPLILDGVETRSKILARFPLRDYQVRTCATTEDHDSYRIKERLMLGLEDYTRKNRDSHTMLMLPGEIQHANLRINTRYIEHKKFVVKPTEFGVHGFWSVKLLFAKKVK